MQIRVELWAHGAGRPERGAASPSPSPTRDTRGERADGEAPLTVEAMRAAIIAIRAGLFDHLGHADADAPEALVGAAMSLRPGGCVPWRDADGAVVLVLAGHAGAGASMVALALAEALTAHRPVQLVEYAEPLRSGLAAASSIELGLDETGWRRGRRGQLDIARLARPAPVGKLPPPPADGKADRLLVVDPGWPLTAALQHADRCERFDPGQRVVVVTRLTVPAVRQTEHLLSALGPQACAGASVAAVGPNRWPRAVDASHGPNLSTLWSDGRVVRIPMDARLEASGLTADPLPKVVATAGRELATLLVPPDAPAETR